MKWQKKRKGILGSLLSFVVSIVVVAIALCVVLAQLSPKQIGVEQEIIINGKSWQELGLADIKVKDLLPLVISLFNDNSFLAQNSPSEQDGVDADNCFRNSTVYSQPVNYGLLVENQCIFQTKHQFYLSEKQLCYVANSALSQLVEPQKEGDVSPILQQDVMDNLQNVLVVMQQFNVVICGLSLEEAEGSLHCKVVLSLDISNYVGQFDVLGDAISKTVFVVLDYKAEVDTDGKLVFSDGTLSINGQDTQISTLVLDALLLVFSNDVVATSEQLTSTIGIFATTVVNNVGKIGKFDAKTENLGWAGMDSNNHIVYFVTYVM